MKFAIFLTFSFFIVSNALASDVPEKLDKENHTERNTEKNIRAIQNTFDKNDLVRVDVLGRKLTVEKPGIIRGLEDKAKDEYDEEEEDSSSEEYDEEEENNYGDGQDEEYDEEEEDSSSEEYDEEEENNYGDGQDEEYDEDEENGSSEEYDEDEEDENNYGDGQDEEYDEEKENNYGDGQDEEEGSDEDPEDEEGEEVEEEAQESSYNNIENASFSITSFVAGVLAAVGIAASVSKIKQRYKKDNYLNAALKPENEETRAYTSYAMA